MEQGIPDFIHSTKLSRVSIPDQVIGTPPPPLEKSDREEESIIELNSPQDIDLPSITLKDAIEHRKSTREFSKTPLNLNELSYLLWSTQGIKTISEHHTLRTVPSAGARHALETFLLVNRVKGLKSGIYHYSALSHQLIKPKLEKSAVSKLIKGFLNQSAVINSAVTFIWVADTYRMEWSYSERSFRYILLDTGHVSENLYLNAQFFDCGVCAIGAFDDDLVNNVLGIDNNNFFAVLAGTVGKLKGGY